MQEHRLPTAAASTTSSETTTQEHRLPMAVRRVLSGMRPTGKLHLGHLCGVLDNWKRLQDDGVECFFFVADWHALTTDYESPPDLLAAAKEMIVTWLAAGIDGRRAALFAQSLIPEHAELHVLLSMICPLSKLMQLPTYKEQKENIGGHLDTYGFLGYPLLQSADILAYRPDSVPVGEDQMPHIEFTREVARRFNHFYGRTKSFEARTATALAALPGDVRERLARARRAYRQDGDDESLTAALEAAAATSTDDAASVLKGYSFYDAEEILPAPRGLLTPTARLPGIDGRKMSKSYNNTIDLFEEPKSAEKKLMRMQTDPARIRRSDRGDPDKCPVWDLHRYFSDDETRAWARGGCESADIGCVDCKKRLFAHLDAALAPLRARRAEVERSGEAEAALQDGVVRARDEAKATLTAVRAAMRLPAR